MTVATRLTALDRFRLSLPGTVLGGTQHLLGSALVNARRSLEDIGQVVGERLQLLEHLENAAGPGDLAALSTAECREVLAGRRVGRLAYIARAGVPDIVPVNYVLDGDAILVRSGAGPKLQAADRHELVAFEVDDLDEQSQTGASVVVLGRAEHLTPEQAAQLAGPVPWAQGPRGHTIRIEPRRTTGRRLL